MGWDGHVTAPYPNKVKRKGSNGNVVPLRGLSSRGADCPHTPVQEMLYFEGDKRLKDMI